MKKWAPVSGWTWQDETYSRILHQLEVISTTLYNVNRKKGSKPMKPGDQFQPDEIKKAKDDYKKRRQGEGAQDTNKKTMRDFWQKRDPGMKFS